MASGTRSAVARGLDRLFGSGSVSGLSEGQLLERFVSRNDASAFEALVARHGPMVLTVCRQWLRDPNDVDDAFQATFLVLVRKAGSIRKRDVLGSWLYGVAYRVAARSCTEALRRQAKESPLDAAEPSRPDDAGDVRLFTAELHEEVRRLPEKYRAPVVLCYLEGLTHEEAAERLQWPVGSVKGRLSRARDLLRSRLTRRGIALASASVVVEELSRSVQAAVPVTLLEPTIQAATKIAASTSLTAAAGIVSARVLVLTEGVIHAMTLHTLKLLAIPCVVAAFMTTGAGVMAYQFGGQGSPKEGEKATTYVLPKDTAKAAIAPAAGVSEQAQALASLTEKTIDMEFDQFLQRLTLSVDPKFASQALRYTLQTRQMLADPKLAASPERLAENQKGHLDRIAQLIVAIKEAKIPPEAKDTELTRARAALAEAARQVNADGRVVPNSGVVFNGGMGGGGMGGGGFDGGADGVLTLDDGRLMIRRLSRRTATLDKSPKSQEIWKKLDEPISMSFAQETPLSDVLKYIKSATAGKTDVGIPIYVDPLALQEAEKTIDSPITLELEGVPLKTTLRLLLKQLDLAYCVTDGLLYIGTPEGVFQELSEAESELIDGREGPSGHPLRPQNGPMGGMGGGFR